MENFETSKHTAKVDNSYVHYIEFQQIFFDDQLYERL